MSDYAAVIQQLTNIQNWIDSVISNNKNLSQFTEATELNTGDFADIFQNGVNKKASLSLLSSFINSRVDLTENAYQTIDDPDPELGMLADQGSQTQGQVQYVVDASFDPSVANGPAYYEFIAEAPSGVLADYRKLSDDEVIEIEEASSFYTFQINQLNTSAGTNTPPGTVKIVYENTGDTVTGIVFNSIFSKYLAAFSSLTASFDFNIKIWNKTQKKTLIGVINNFTYTNPSNQWYLVGVDNVTFPMDRNDLSSDDVVEIQISVQQKAAVQTPPIQNIDTPYVDVTAMYADQGNQIKGFLQDVTDASGHPDVDSGDATFKYLGTTNGDNTDYRVFVAGELKTRIIANESAIQAITSSYSRRPKVTNIVDNTVAPPTEVSGDRYILDFTGASHADWDGASAGDIVEFNGTTWDATTPLEGWIAYLDDQNKDALYVDDGSPIWEVRDIIVVDHSALNLDDGTNPHGTTKGDVGLGNVDNTSDADKPVSTAQQTALDLKVDDSQIIDEDNMSSNSDTHVPTQQSVKTYVDTEISNIDTAKYYHFSASDELSDLVVDLVTPAYSGHIPYAMTVAEVMAGVGTVSSGSQIEFDIHINGTTIFSTLPTIDVGEETTLTAATAAVITNNSWAKGDKIEVFITQVGSTTPGAGLKIYVLE